MSQLLKLAEPVDIENGVVTPACIPADNTNTFDNEEGIVAGWGNERIQCKRTL